MHKSDAFTNALIWATRAEDEAEQYPHVSTSNMPRLDVATKMATMWTRIAEVLPEDAD